MSAQAPDTRRGGRRPAQQSNALVRVDEKTAASQLVSLVEARTDQFLALFAGDAAMVERFKTVALHAATTNPKLLQADPLTVVESIRNAATLGLELNGVGGEGYLVPYWNKDKSKYDCQFQPGYRGLKKLVDRSGKVLDVQAVVVYEGDEFDYADGSEAYVHYRSAWKERGNRLGTIAWALLPNPQGKPLTKVVLLTEAEAEMIRQSSRAADKGPWVDWPDEMRKKSAVKRLVKLLPTDPMVERAVEIENRAESTYAPAPADGERRELRGRAKARAALGVAGPEPESEPPAPSAGQATTDDGRPVDEDGVIDGEVAEAAPTEQAELDALADAVFGEAPPTLSSREFQRRMDASGLIFDQDVLPKLRELWPQKHGGRDMTPADWHRLAVEVGLA